MTAIDYDTAKHAVTLAMAAHFGLIDAKGRTVALDDLINTDVDEAVAHAAATGQPIPELAEYSQQLSKVHTDEKLLQMVYETAKTLLRKYCTEPTTREVTGTYAEAAASAARTLDAIDLCEEAETLGELFAHTDTFMRVYADTLVDVFTAVTTSATALVDDAEERQRLVGYHRTQLDEQLSYVESVRDTLDDLRRGADSVTDPAARNDLTDQVYSQIEAMETHLSTIMDTAETNRNDAVEKIRVHNQTVDIQNNPVPIDGRSLAGV